ncbi:MAG: hypothetical protein QOG13_3046 [Sphingomonadales bacterium]|jgi:hypothetical protein|nr:hypothetical protein [Sphingomonadales bacterium]
MQELLIFTPENDLERAIAQAKAEAVPVDQALDLAADAMVHIPSTASVHPNGDGFEPLLMKAGLHKLIACFSAPSRLALYREQAAHAFALTGREFFLRIPPGYGAILNPGYAAQMILTPDKIASMKPALGWIDPR